MDIRTKCDGFQLPAATGEYLDERLAHIEKLLGADADLARCEVELKRDAGKPRHGANIWCAEIQILHPGGDTMRATNHAESLNGAIDDAKAELERQIRGDKRVGRREERKEGAKLKRFLHEEE